MVSTTLVYKVSCRTLYLLHTAKAMCEVNKYSASEPARNRGAEQREYSVALPVKVPFGVFLVRDAEREALHTTCMPNSLPGAIVQAILGLSE